MLLRTPLSAMSKRLCWPGARLSACRLSMILDLSATRVSGTLKSQSLWSPTARFLLPTTQSSVVNLDILTVTRLDIQYFTRAQTAAPPQSSQAMDAGQLLNAAAFPKATWRSSTAVASFAHHSFLTRRSAAPREPCQITARRPMPTAHATSVASTPAIVAPLWPRSAASPGTRS